MSKLGDGSAFRKLVGKLKDKGNSETSSKKIAAAIGRKKYGKKKFQAMAAKGRMNAAKKKNY